VTWDQHAVLSPGERVGRFRADGFTPASGLVDGYPTGVVPFGPPAGLSLAAPLTMSQGHALTAPLTLAAVLDAAMASDGAITNAQLGVVLSCAAELLAPHALTGSASASLSLASTLASQGDLAGSLGAIADVVAALVSDGRLNGSNLTGTVKMDASMTTEGSAVTASACAVAVWNALAAAFNQPGSMGEKLNLAGSGGVDYNALAAAVLAAAAAAPIHADIKKVNARTINGAGTDADPFGPV
jgi:hypothetical protein